MQEEGIPGDCADADARGEDNADPGIAGSGGADGGGPGSRCG